MNAVAPWTSEELDHIGQAQELHLATRRQQGGLSRYVTMWVVRASDGLYVRSAYGPHNPWYRRATAVGEGRVRADGIERDVTFESADSAVQAAIDAAYHAKYDRYGPQIVASVTGPKAHAVTIRLAKSDRQDLSARPNGSEQAMSDVTVVIGAGQVGQAIACRVSPASAFCSPISTRTMPPPLRAVQPAWV